ncbi:hypothetical protein BX666DRAFT_261559 [Dichotomocladium elegans]|nr:hypothetical protein BX666DRAFT_261559 [Dichotomocladium elegans]
MYTLSFIPSPPTVLTITMLSTAKNDTAPRRHRTTSFVHPRENNVTMPRHSQSSGSSQIGPAEMNTGSAKPLDSIHERIARVSVAEKPSSLATPPAASASTGVAVSRQSRLPRRQYVRLQKNNTMKHAYPNTRPSQSEVIQRCRQPYLQEQQQQQQSRKHEIHSIWSITADEKKYQDTTNNNKNDTIRQLLQRTFQDLFPDEAVVSTETMVHRIRARLDEQQSRIQQLESSQARLLASDYRAQFELEKRALLKQQEEQFETLKLKYRVGLEQIVEQWLSHEAAEQEQWMDQIQQQTEQRVASLEGQWKERAARLQEQLKRHQA